MTNNQAWENCKYHIGDLDINLEEISKTNNTVKLLSAIFKESDEARLLRINGVNQEYNCKNSEIIKLQIYPKNGMSKEKQGDYDIVAKLFHLDISNDERDLFGEDRDCLDNIIDYGLRMCKHCKFYER